MKVAYNLAWSAKILTLTLPEVTLWNGLRFALIPI